MNSHLNNFRSQQHLIADAPLSDSPALSSPPPTQSTQADPLVDKGGQELVIIGAVLLLFGVVAVVGVFSRKIEHVIIAALAMSLLLIGFFLVTKH